MKRRKQMIAWELFGAEDEGWRDDNADFEAINTAILDLASKASNDRAAGKISSATYKKFLEQFADWKTFYETTKNSWYLSDDDIAFARKKRNDINSNYDPESFKFVQAHSKDTKIARAPDDPDSDAAKRKKFWNRMIWGGVIIGGVWVGAQVFFIGKLAPALVKVLPIPKG